MANQLKFGVGPTNDQYISIQQFYTGKNIFITGATGFVGKVYNLYVNHECCFTSLKLILLHILKMTIF